MVFFRWLGGNPEQDSPTIIIVEHRFNGQGGTTEERVTNSGDKFDSGGAASLSFDMGQVTKVMENMNKYLGTSLTSSHKLSPAVWPTEKEFNDAKERFGYTSGKLHFAIVGNAGSGKSSLVNSLRGLHPGEHGAAETGANETTTEPGRYPHSAKDPSLEHIMWYDIPGAGTQTTPGGSTYFNSQGLFIFDFIIVVTGTRFTQQDWNILENCKMYNIPSFVVRPMADIHIENIKRDKRCDYNAAKRTYIAETRKKFKEELRNASRESGLDYDTEIFLVSNALLCNFIKSLMDSDGKILAGTEALIDEDSLVMNLLVTAQMRRYPSKYGMGWALLKVHSLQYVLPS